MIPGLTCLTMSLWPAKADNFLSPMEQLIGYSWPSLEICKEAFQRDMGLLAIAGQQLNERSSRSWPSPSFLFHPKINGRDSHCCSPLLCPIHPLLPPLSSYLPPCHNLHWFSLFNTFKNIKGRSEILPMLNTCMSTAYIKVFNIL